MFSFAHVPPEKHFDETEQYCQLMLNVACYADINVIDNESDVVYCFCCTRFPCVCWCASSSTSAISCIALYIVEYAYV